MQPRPIDETRSSTGPSVRLVICAVLWILDRSSWFVLPSLLPEDQQRDDAVGSTVARPNFFHVLARCRQVRPLHTPFGRSLIFGDLVIKPCRGFGVHPMDQTRLRCVCFSLRPFLHSRNSAQPSFAKPNRRPFREDYGEMLGPLFQTRPPCRPFGDFSNPIGSSDRGKQ
jgi:hypothetical protein